MEKIVLRNVWQVYMKLDVTSWRKNQATIRTGLQHINNLFRLFLNDLENETSVSFHHTWYGWLKKIFLRRMEFIYHLNGERTNIKTVEKLGSSTLCYSTVSWLLYVYNYKYSNLHAEPWSVMWEIINLSGLGIQNDNQTTFLLLWISIL